MWADAFTLAAADALFTIDIFCNFHIHFAVFHAQLTVSALCLINGKLIKTEFIE